MAIRVYAIYDRNRRVLCLLVLVLLVTTAIGCVRECPALQHWL